MTASTAKVGGAEAFAAEPFVDEDREPFAAFVCDDVTRETVGRVAERRGWSDAEVRRGGIGGALRTLGIAPPPRIMVIDVSEASGPAEAVEGLAEIASADSAVVALGTQNDVELFRRMLAAGAADYLVKPIDAEALETALERAEQPTHGPGDSPERQGRLIYFVGARGGVGTTTLASNSAWLMSEELRRRVAAVDLDLQFGTLALALDLEPGRGLREALEDPERVDDVFIDRATTRMSDRLHVLAAEESLDDAPQAAPGGVANLIQELRRHFDAVVADVPRGLVGREPALMSEADEIVVVCELSLTDLRDVNRLVHLARMHAPKAQLRVVANRVDPRDKGQLSRKDFERGLEVKLQSMLPLESDALAKAAVTGKPLAAVARRSRVTRGLRDLSVELVGVPKRRKKSLWRRVLR